MTGVTFAVESAVATLTLAEPESKNALSPGIIDGLIAGIAQACGDNQVRVIVLSNEGNTFCAGANLKDRSHSTRYTVVDLFTAIRDAPKPVVGRIAGHCFAGGIGVAAACDISIAVADAMFGFTEVRLGVAPAIISAVCVPKMRIGDARELMLTGRRFSAAHAAEVGLINEAATAAELDTKVSDVVRHLIAGGPRALQMTKNLINRVPQLDRDTAFKEMAALSMTMFDSAEAAEGLAAFRERRTAPWVPSQPHTDSLTNRINGSAR